MWHQPVSSASWSASYRVTYICVFPVCLYGPWANIISTVGSPPLAQALTLNSGKLLANLGINQRLQSPVEALHGDTRVLGGRLRARSLWWWIEDLPKKQRELCRMCCNTGNHFFVWNQSSKQGLACKATVATSVIKHFILILSWLSSFGASKFLKTCF